MCVYIYITDEGTSQIHTNPSVTDRKDRKTRDPMTRTTQRRDHNNFLAAS